jgi:cell division protein FtsX
MPDPQDQQTKIIDEQRKYLAKLQADFNEKCDKITEKSIEELKGVPETNLETRQKIYLKQKAALDEALSELKNEITRSNKQTRIKLEEIYNQKVESELLELEEMMKKV